MGVALASLTLPTLPERIAWAASSGFSGVELLATGEPWGLHAPGISKEDRARLRDLLMPFVHIAARAPHKDTFDVSLVSPSAAIRRASVSEIWSVCRLLEAVGGGIVIVRAGWAPDGVTEDRQRAWLGECLTTLDRMAGEHNTTIGVGNYDYFDDPENFGLLSMLRLRHTGIALEMDRIRGGESVAAGVFRENAAHVVHVQVRTASPVIAAALTEGAYPGMVCLALPSETPPSQVLHAKAEWDALLAGS